MNTGWFADIADAEDNAPDDFPWAPFLQAAGGCFPLPIYFNTQAACEAFIATDVLGQGLLETK